MSDLFRDTYSGGAGNFDGRIPDGVGGAYTADPWNDPDLDLTGKLIDGSGHAPSSSSSFVAPKSQFSRAPTGDYTLEVKLAAASPTDTVVIDVVLGDSANPASYPSGKFIAEIYAVSTGGGDYSVTFYVWDIGLDDYTYSSDPDGPFTCSGDGAHQLDFIATPTGCSFKIDGVEVANSAGVISDVLPDTVSVIQNYSTVNGEQLLDSVRVYTPGGGPAPSLGFSFNSYRPHIFSPG